MPFSEPNISEYMTKIPKCLSVDTSLHDALEVMRQSKSRYLPVLAGSRVVGILQDNALRLAASLLGSETYTAADLMSPHPAVARPNASLYQVLDDTPSNTCGCTVVQTSDGNVVGMFTPKEALLAVRVLARESRNAS